jgi:hypothetical protein
VIRPRNFSDLTVARQEFVRLAQRINYGQILGLSVRNGDPVLSPGPVVLLDIKLPGDGARREIGLVDFVLPAEISALMVLFDELRDGVIDVIHVQAGLPRRITLRSTLTEALR